MGESVVHVYGLYCLDAIEHIARVVRFERVICFVRAVRRAHPLPVADGLLIGTSAYNTARRSAEVVLGCYTLGTSYS